MAREVGTEGKLGGQAEVQGVAGTWKDLTDNVNSMASNLTGQVRNIAEVTTAVANGDLSQEDHRRRQGRDPRAEEHHQHDGRSAQRRSPSEVTRVAREVGTEGKLGGQAEVRGVAGTWKDLTDNVNSMASNLTGQVRNIAEVTTAVANGDLSKKITVDVKGEILELKNTINTMVDQLNVVRLRGDARGARGRHRRQARRPGRGARASPAPGRTSPTTSTRWPSNLTGQVRNIAEVTTAVANGDLSQKITVDVQGRDPRAQEHHQHDGRSAERRSPSR